ncbi:hypothetical protein LX87_01820 [Larkinella arboricola]|uniref:Uncharacterized protein n=1 Tax=Larkinella arboricola TaxID=643671 RepID=A0A327X1R7_LARAB|nr:hypothetical protein LX87_01820 [Larkinella arboricola]
MQVKSQPFFNVCSLKIIRSTFLNLDGLKQVKDAPATAPPV